MKHTVTRIASRTGIVAVLVFLGRAAGAGEGAGPERTLEPFAMPSLEAPSGAADVSFLLDPPAGGRGFVEARDGRFLAGGRRIRFWGVNVCFGACFPERDVAALVAERLARSGVNCVRFHHMDMNPFPSGIFKDRKLEELSPEALERLDAFIAELAKRGIYTNLNLHVSRWWSRAHGWPGANDLESFDKMVDIFHPELIEAQRRYARDLLTHRNPHTGRRYAEEPAVAMVEITNEDSLFQWGSMGNLRRMPEPYAEMLRERWNRWLLDRYRDDAGLRKAWGGGEEPLGKDLIRDAGFETALAANRDGRAWDLERHSAAAAEIRGAKGPEGIRTEGTRAVRIEIARIGEESWHIQFKQTGLSLKKGKHYTVRFQARADEEKSVGLNAGQEKSPWKNLGLSATARLGKAWKSFRFGFVAADDEEDSRLSFAIGGDRTAVELAGVSLRPGGRTALEEGESLASKSVALFPEGDASTEGRLDDRLRFLRDVEKAYFTGMRDFLKKELGLRAPVTGTIAFGALGTEVQAEMDFVDQHSYWQHPQFPRRPWDPRDWIIPNRALSAAADGGTLPGLASTRVAGKPYTVTEYNHPAPLDSQAETVPLIASFAAWQDWDGVFLFAYNHSETYRKDRIGSFFDIDANPAKMGFLGAGALIFAGQRLGAAPSQEVFSLDEKKTLEAARLDPTHLDRLLRRSGFSLDGLLEKRWAVRFGKGSAGATSDAPGPGALRWDRTAGRERYTADGPSAKVICGKMAGAIDLSGARFEISGPAAASLILVSRAEAPLAESKSILLVACGRAENTGMGWNADRSSVADRWGSAPTAIEPVRGTIRIAGDPLQKAYALDGKGGRIAEVPVRNGPEGSVLRIGDGPATLWYEITR